MIGPPAERADAMSEAEVEAALREALATERPRAAAARVAALSGLPVNELYRRALALRGG